MKIGVLSDTHGNTAALNNAIAEIKRHGEMDAWFHLGDVASDILRLSDHLNAPIYAVSGNCDYAASVPTRRIVELGGKKFFLTHGHEYAVRFNTAVLSDAAAAENCDAAVYGHTHIPLIEYGKVWILNPGSTSKPLYPATTPTCAIITIENDQMRFEILEI